MANEQIQRYGMVSLTRCGDAWQELKADKEGDWVSYDDHLAATTDLREGQMHLAMELERKDEQIRKLREALGMLYDKWENGLPCQEACDGQIDDDSPCIGNAFRLSLAEEQTILNLIITGPAEFEQACANCGKPYRAHLLHDRNKCSVEGDAAWFPENIATAITANRAALKEGE